MTGSKITLDATFTSATGRKLRKDFVLPEAGALLLLDAAHSLGGLGGAGVPTAATVLSNVAWDQAAVLFGSGTATSLSPIMQNFFSGVGTTVAERTPKGGLHVANRQDAYTTNNGRRIAMPAALQTYLAANPTHKYYMSVWDRLTRASVAPITEPLTHAGILGATPGGTNYIWYFNNGPLGGPIGANDGRRLPAVPNVVSEPRFQNGAAAAHGSLSAPSLYFYAWPCLPDWSGFAASQPNDIVSSVLYRFYLEDLTVSGRTYAAVDALDYAAFQEAFAAGGRYYGDSWTAPATLAGA